jgi:hypothetical protein
MDDWAHFELQTGVTSLAVFRGHVVGSGDKGELLIGDKKGKFNRIRFGKTVIFSVLSKGNDIFVCTDRGLFKLGYICNQVTLLSVKLGCPVTDVDVSGDNLILATLFEGIQTINV